MEQGPEGPFFLVTVLGSGQPRVPRMSGFGMRDPSRRSRLSA